jgi:hypothetical protein
MYPTDDEFWFLIILALINIVLLVLIVRRIKMQIVIKLSEDSYKALCRGSMLPPDVENVVQGIKNGTPLPKGHSRLIAEPTEEDIAKTIGGQSDFADCIRDSVKAVYNNAPTIIEADKEDKE